MGNDRSLPSITVNSVKLLWKTKAYVVYCIKRLFIWKRSLLNVTRRSSKYYMNTSNAKKAFFVNILENIFPAKNQKKDFI